MRVLWLIACVLLGGCLLESANAGRKLSDTVEAMNKATRWGQLDQAERLVDPIYRSRFTASHAHWGRSIQLADSEVMQVELAPDKDSAISIIAYQWYTNDAMDLRQSVVRQRWSRSGGSFGLFSEAVVQGDPRLLQPNGPKVMTTAGGELGIE